VLFIRMITALQAGKPRYSKRRKRLGVTRFHFPARNSEQAHRHRERIVHLIKPFGRIAAAQGEYARNSGKCALEPPGLIGDSHEAQPEMTEAIQHLREAQRNIESAMHNKGGHRETALQLVNQVITEVEAGIQYDNTH
jgi:hypothetical protein